MHSTAAWRCIQVSGIRKSRRSPRRGSRLHENGGPIAVTKFRRSEVVASQVLTSNIRSIIPISGGNFRLNYASLSLQVSLRMLVCAWRVLCRFRAIGPSRGGTHEQCM